MNAELKDIGLALRQLNGLLKKMQCTVNLEGLLAFRNIESVANRDELEAAWHAACRSVEHMDYMPITVALQWLEGAEIQKLIRSA